MLKQKEENIIQYFIFALAQAIKKVNVLRFLTVTRSRQDIVKYKLLQTYLHNIRMTISMYIV